MQRQQQSFEDVAAYQSVSVELSGTDTPVLLESARVSASLFPVLGVAPHLGRTFLADEDTPGVSVAVLSWSLWHARFGGNPAVIGKTIVLDRRPYAVVGVMPAGFEFPRRGPELNNRQADVWVPIAFTNQQRQGRGDEFNYSAVARLKRGTSLEQARAELALLARQINDSYPQPLKSAGFTTALGARPLREEIAGRGPATPPVVAARR